MKISLIVILSFIVFRGTAQTISGNITDDKTKEPLIGAMIQCPEENNAVLADVNGNYELKVLSEGKKHIIVSYSGYLDCDTLVTVKKGEKTTFNLSLKENIINIENVQVVGRRRFDTDAGVLSGMKMTEAVVSGVSSSQISRTSDRDAGEVVKRIPGISIIDDRFIIVRGLSQRYNNVWLNNGAVPSSEAESRAFSFDVLPSSQINNIMIVKSPAAELPADFSGGFIKITTKDMPSESSIDFGITTGFNTITHSRKTYLNSGKSDDWSVKERTPLPDIRANMAWNAKLSERLGMVLAAGFSNVYSTNSDVINRRYGVYNGVDDKPTIEKDYKDNRYGLDRKYNAMNNWTYRLNSFNKLEFRNVFNYIDKNRFTERYGASLVSGEYYERQTEMYRSKRLTYSGQLAGKHELDDKNNSLDWNLGYSYANKNEPNRRIAKYIGAIPEDGVLTPSLPAYNDMITRYNQHLSDNIASLGADYKKIWENMSFNPTLRAGVYGEYRTRDYNPTESVYRYDKLSYEELQEYITLPLVDMMSPNWVNGDKVYSENISRKSNSYSGDNSIAAAYVSATLPLGKFNVYAGVRAEQWNMSVKYDRSLSPDIILNTEHKYDKLSILPSLNITYNFNDKHLLRAAYGRTVNRPEFREVSPSVYYDFNLFAEVQGNPSLKMAEIDNVDLRYEFYPSSTETVSVGAFYKHFKNPIEWNFVDMGGSYRYSFSNAESAYSAGVEVDIRKSLDFISVPQLTLVFNATVIASEVKFSQDGLIKEKNRPLQGQSPFLVNAGLFYKGEKNGVTASILYNIIGKRIVGVGKTTSLNNNTDYDVPDSYEMPRNVVDLTLGKRFGKKVELKLSAKDVLSQFVEFKQFPTTTIAGKTETRGQTTLRYRPGTSFTLGVSFKFE